MSSLTWSRLPPVNLCTEQPSPGQRRHGSDPIVVGQRCVAMRCVGAGFVDVRGGGACGGEQCLRIARPTIDSFVRRMPSCSRGLSSWQSSSGGAGTDDVRVAQRRSLQSTLTGARKVYLDTEGDCRTIETSRQTPGA